MSDFGVEFNTKGVDQAMSTLTGLGKRARDARPAFDATVDHLVDAQKRRFDALGQTKESTREAKARDRDPRVRAHASESGVATGELREFMTTKGSKAQPVKMTNDEVIFGVPARHKLAPRAFQLVKIGKSPLISREVARRLATQSLKAHLADELGPSKRSAR